ncbi:MAG: DUF2059 domain-containing protein [Sphingomonadaceae bacterium]|uniref:DUF2059 domain-containing protein n=1 Tax=Thermaurantiacus sp. TaxID=2820283 RepID=UPI00298F0236|nr:DUF2059 domain-containing protein [Thermaurantiacus sp.]MCS6986224.1 DUF2059 domain-containing protein [Sphingomonadaceae bacterium]MDW8415881.1 DUF2059 domain-containing protein [Thermaurantiacus sp.]
MRARVAFLALVWVGASPAAAQGADSVAAATRLVALLAPEAVERQQLERQLAQIRSGAAIRAMFAGNPRFRQEAAKNPPAFDQAIARMGAIQADAVGPVMREMLPATRKATIAAYARAFTAAELDQIAAFYRTPAGAKFLRTQPQVQAEVARQIGQQFGPRMEAAHKSAGPRIEAELRKLFPAPSPGG